ncbi:MAG: hypothetical protein EA387_15745 [Nitriliruptor sp.]|nr:MAG: hypothetical protein EA387_15745 [Nitriliruptor sp.]
MFTGREVLMAVDGVPVTVVSGRQTCIEVGDDDAGGGSWCGPDDMPEAVWLGAISVGDDLVVVGQAPDEVVSVTLSGEDGPSRLAVEQTGQGRFFVGVDVRPGDYEVAAETEDGSQYAAGEVSLGRDGTTVFWMTP